MLQLLHFGDNIIQKNSAVNTFNREIWAICQNILIFFEKKTEKPPDQHHYRKKITCMDPNCIRIPSESFSTAQSKTARRGPDIFAVILQDFKAL